ncbi:PqqD family protein [Lacihabitans lacunae]|uniref:PqqD family protein n=1 Tax=Lacihabitans lacunae TaxID=1028214 RepID=A0ABV7Z168_9BACT
MKKIKKGDKKNKKGNFTIKTYKIMETKYALSEQQISSTLQEENIILQLNKGIYYTMNEVGTFIWDLLKISPLQFEEIVEQVQDNFDVDDDTCRKDIEIVIQDLTKAELLVQVI